MVLKQFGQPDEVREMSNGKYEIVKLGDVAIGRATYQPGWKWSVDVGASLGQEFCLVEHRGLVLSGKATAAFLNGAIIEMKAGDIFYVPSEAHDSWVVGDEPYVSLHFSGVEKYSKA